MTERSTPSEVLRGRAAEVVKLAQSLAKEALSMETMAAERRADVTAMMTHVAELQAAAARLEVQS